MKAIKSVIFGSLTAAWVACSTPATHELQVGNWRGEFILDNHQVPFNFVVEDDTTALVKVFLTNADEKAPLDSIYYQGDSVILPIKVYDAVLIAKVESDSLKGFFRKNQSAKQGIPFRAARNQSHR
ncbi:MAG: hypothetical protein ACKOE5_12700, partial [Cytophagales bacterium]